MVEQLLIISSSRSSRSVCVPYCIRGCLWSCIVCTSPGICRWVMYFRQCTTLACPGSRVGCGWFQQSQLIFEDSCAMRGGGGVSYTSCPPQHEWHVLSASAATAAACSSSSRQAYEKQCQQSVEFAQGQLKPYKGSPEAWSLLPGGMGLSIWR